MHDVIKVYPISPVAPKASALQKTSAQSTASSSREHKTQKKQPLIYNNNNKKKHRRHTAQAELEVNDYRQKQAMAMI